MDTKKTTFEPLSALNVSDHIDRKPASGGKDLTYLSWPWAFDQISRFDPDWSFRVIEFTPEGVELPEGEHGRQYQKVLGDTYMVQTEVTVKGQTRRMWLPIMGSGNYAMKDEPYTVQIKSRGGGFNVTVPAVDVMALNRTIMRCLVKNLALFGLGLYIYSGEDTPFSEPEEAEASKPEPRPEMDLEAAKSHVILTGKVAGQTMLGLYQTKPAFVTLYAEKGTNPDDRLAAQILLKAAADGKIPASPALQAS